MKYIFMLFCAVSLLLTGCDKPQKPVAQKPAQENTAALPSAPYRPSAPALKKWSENELPQDKTILLAAIKSNAQNIAREKIALGKELTVPDKEGCTPIYLAAKKGQLSILKMLLDQDVNPNSSLQGKPSPTFSGVCVQEDYKVYTPMHVAVEMGYSEVVRYMLARQVKVDDCLLFAAIKQGNPTTVEVLVKNGAKKTVKTKQGKTPVELAQELGKKDMLARLSDAQEESLIENSR